MTAAPAVEAVALTKTYPGGVEAVQGVDLRVEQGEVYGIAETLANVIPTQEEYVGAVPALALLPWFFAGSLFPIRAMPPALCAVARLPPLTHALALMGYGLAGDRGVGLHDIWGMASPTAMARLNLLVVAGSAAAATALSVRVFTRSAVG